MSSNQQIQVTRERNPEELSPKAPSFPLLFSDTSSLELEENSCHNTQSPMLCKNTHRESCADCHTNADCVTIGAADMDLIELDLYDVYRKEDSAGYTKEYLLRCRDKLRAKVREGHLKIHVLQKSNLRKELKTKKQKRIRMFYETIAFERSRSGLMVRTAMGASSSAAKVIQVLKVVFSVSEDSHYQ